MIIYPQAKNAIALTTVDGAAYYLWDEGKLGLRISLVPNDDLHRLKLETFGAPNEVLWIRLTQELKGRTP